MLSDPLRTPSCLVVVVVVVVVVVNVVVVNVFATVDFAAASGGVVE